MTAPYPLLCWGPAWFRVRGFGVRYVNHRKTKPLFSERNGYKRTLHLGPHCFAWLRP